jgi:hypothetical protein
MQTVNIKRKELNVKYPARLIVEDEVKAEPIQFIIASASSINNYEHLSFYLQYRNNLDEYGFEHLESTYDEDSDKITLLWEPSAYFTKERGKVEIQIVGYLASYQHTEDVAFLENKEYFVLVDGSYNKLTINTDGHTSPYVGQSVPVYEEEIDGQVYEYISQTRWSTVKCPLSLPENIYDTEIELPDVNYIEKSLTDMRQMVARTKGVVEEVTDIRDEVASYADEVKEARDQAVEASSRAYTYMEGAESYYKSTQELAEYLDKYQYKAYRTTIGNGGRTYTVAHGLQTDNIIVQCWPVAGGEPPAYTATRIDDSILQLDFSEDIGTLSMDVVISAIDRSLMEEVPIENVTNISFITPSEILAVLNGEEE